MALTRPTAQITLDGRTLTSAEAALVRLDIWMSVDGQHDAARLLLWRRSKLATARVGAVLSVSINDEDVWSGEVVELVSGADAVRIDGLCKTIALSRRRVSQTFAEQTIEDIVRDLAGEVGVDQIDASMSLPAYSVDDRRAVWNHLQDLAVLAGAELASNASGELCFVPPRSGPADETLRYGAELIAYSIGNGKERTPPGIAAHGAGSEQGSEKWHWILREPTNASGTSGPLRAIPSLRTRDAAQTTGDALSKRAARSKTHGRLACVGNASLRAGSLIELSDLPDDAEVPALRMTSVHQVLDARSGFVTCATLEAAAGGAF